MQEVVPLKEGPAFGKQVEEQLLAATCLLDKGRLQLFSIDRYVEAGDLPNRMERTLSSWVRL